MVPINQGNNKLKRNAYEIDNEQEAKRSHTGSLAWPSHWFPQRLNNQTIINHDVSAQTDFLI